MRKYSKDDINKIIAHLLADDTDINDWHSPRGVSERRRESVLFKMSKDEFWVFRHLAKKYRLTISEFIRWLVIGRFIKDEPTIWVECTREIGKENMLKLFGVAARKAKITDKGKMPESLSVRKPKRKVAV
jgi:hypothetical protein